MMYLLFIYFVANAYIAGAGAADYQQNNVRVLGFIVDMLFGSVINCIVWLADKYSTDDI